MIYGPRRPYWHEMSPFRSSVGISPLRTYHQEFELARALSIAWERAHPKAAYERRALRYAEKQRRIRIGASVVSQRRRGREKNAPGRGVSADEWQQVVDESLGLCAYCNKRRPLTMDHIEPLAAGGAHDLDNVAAICKPCNSSKNDWPLLVWLAQRAFIRLPLIRAA